MVQASTIKKAALGLVAGATLAVAGTAAAANNPGNTRPGWGYGDKNHVHTGPPGQSVRVENTSTTTVNNTQTARSGNARGYQPLSGNASNSASITASSNASSNTSTSQ
jgi:hypothetical protein